MFLLIAVVLVTGDSSRCGHRVVVRFGLLMENTDHSLINSAYVESCYSLIQSVAVCKLHVWPL